MNDNKLKHLEFIQNVITRMNTNSFMIKGWMTTLVAALFALAAKDADQRFLYVTFFPIVFFWALDAYYLSQERQFRDLYKDVSQKEETVIDFSMNTETYNKDYVDEKGTKIYRTWSGTAGSKTLLLTYVPVLVLVGVIALFVKCSAYCQCSCQ